MASKKMTRATALEIAITVLEDSNVPTDVEAVEVLRKMYEQVTKSRTTEGEKPKTKTALENEASARSLYSKATDKPFNGQWVMEHSVAMTPQKVVGIMQAGIRLGLFEKFKDGKQTVYRKVEKTEEEQPAEQPEN